MKASIYYISTILLLTLATSPKAYTQPQAYIDSLEAALDTIQVPLKKAIELHRLAVICQKIDITKAIDYAYAALHTLPKGESIRGHGNIYSTLGTLYGNSGNLDSANSYFTKALAVYEKINYKEGISLVYGNLGGVYAEHQQYLKASEYTYKSLYINDSLGDKDGFATNLMALSSISYATRDYLKALNHAKRALHIYTELDDQYNSARAHFNVGTYFLVLEKIDSSIFHLNIAAKIAKAIPNFNMMAIAYTQLVQVYFQKGDLSSAIEYSEKAITLIDYITTPSRKIILLNSLADFYLTTKEYAKSLKHFQKGLELAINEDLKALQKDALEGISKNYAALGNYPEAYHYQLEVSELKDSILDSEKQGQLKELEVKYETEKKEQANIILAKERDVEKLKASRSKLFVIGLSIVLVLVLVLAFLLLRQHKIQANTQTLALKHKLLRNQMNPHFIFNSLIAIQNYIYKSEPRVAVKFVSSFAKLVRAILENSRNEQITLAKEIQWLENYLKLQLLRFENKFVYNISIDEDLDLDLTLIPPMLTQPFIENALEHGLKSLSYQGILDVKFTTEANHLIVSIQDNGIGFDENSVKTSEKKNHISLATLITEERLSFFNKKTPKKIYFNIQKLPTNGTLVLFKIPYNQIS